MCIDELPLTTMFLHDFETGASSKREQISQSNNKLYNQI